MSLHLHLRSESGRAAVTLGRVCTLVVCLALSACAGTPSRAAGDRPSAGSPLAAQGAQPGDSAQRNRQFQRAEALYLSGRLKEAAAAFLELTRAYPNDARVWLKYGNTLTKLGTYEDAATAFQTAAALDPTQGGAPLNLALVRIAQTRDALDVALSRLQPGSAEHTEAEGLRRQVMALLGPSSSSPSTH